MKKGESHQRIFHIQKSLGSKCQLQQTILIFGNTFLKKGYFQSKTKKMNIPIEFFVFELL